MAESTFSVLCRRKDGNHNPSINFDAGELKSDANDLEVTPKSHTQMLTTVIAG
jgi:hypothetical protein